jgi:hypothetical protein
MMRKWILGPFILAVAVVLAACGSSNKKDSTPTAAATPTVESAATGLDLNAGPGLNTGGNSSSGTQLPGCSDLNDTECPAPLVLDLDGEASAGGVTIKYPTRYFTAAANDSEDILIEITPSDNNKFSEKATFQVYYAGSVDAALAGLTDPITAAWTAGTLSGTVGVVKDQTQDPPVNTTIGAFALSDGRAVVFKAITTGKYGWDLYSRLYQDMLNTLVVSQ